MFACCSTPEDVAEVTDVTAKISGTSEQQVPGPDVSVEADGKKDPPQAEGGVFTAEIERGEGGFGLSLDFLNEVLDADRQDYCMVTKVTPGGAVDTWNSANAGKNQILVNDRILEVDGKRGSSKSLQDTIKAAQKVTLTLQHAKENTATIRQAETGPLGIDISYSDNGRSLIMTKVKEGPVNDWNIANPSAAIQSGDRITAVNGKTGEPAELLEMLKAASGEIVLKALTWESGK
eukprot:TRINITY_DN65315_c0_g1_i1.p1 TRINITY_DN65315_c0_g1~~TRINITY_DN65315_c0_g1_i1.p1  ORF type:complete len:269 (-),score=63.87 TRINITY_DN65315_c0_g1_i1:126-827(-)